MPIILIALIVLIAPIVYGILGVIFFPSKYETDINGIDIYINEDYADENDYDDPWIHKAGKLAKKFFPKYSEIDYNYKDVEFYLYSNNIGYPDTVLTLEIVFDNIDEYNFAKNDVNSQYEFLEEKVTNGNRCVMPSPEFKINNFDCKVVKANAESYPKHFGIICTNDTEMIIRYVYCYDTDLDILSSMSELIDGIKKSEKIKW